MKKILLSFLFLISFSVIALIATGHKYILTAISKTYLQGHNTANIDDYTAFNTREIKTATPIPWTVNKDYSSKELPSEFLDDLAKNDAVAFLIAHKGEIISENYFAGYDNRSKTNSFSMAKTVVTLLLGKAIEEGYIKSFNQPITDFIPEFKEKITGKTPTIGSFSTMTSGYNWDEHYYSPFSPTVELLYGDDVESFVLERTFDKHDTPFFYYSSASTEILTIAISRALKAKNPEMTISDYLSNSLWKPLGMNDNALWHLDSKGMELGYCCINTNARNFAKLGQLMLQNGTWEGKQLIDSNYIQKMHTPGVVDHYGYSTWINTTNPTPYYLFRGHLGQYIIIVPNKELVIVRLGKTRGASGDEGVDETLNSYVNEAIKFIE